MDMRNRRDMQLAYVADEAVMEEMTVCKRLLQKLNFIDRSDYNCTIIDVAKVKIGDNVWLGGNTVVCPGVHIGNNVVIGAGSVVTKDIPDWSIAAGNPCRVIRTITEDDKRKLFHNEEIDDEAWNIICAQP